MTALHLAVKKNVPLCGCLLLFYRWKTITMFQVSLSGETAHELARKENKVLFLLPMLIVGEFVVPVVRTLTKTKGSGCTEF